jgi:hypothetical protein
MKPLKLLLILTILLTSVNSFAATSLNKDDPAPYPGLLFNKAEEKQLRKNNEELKLLRKLRVTQEELIENQKDQIGILKGKLESRDVSGLVKTLYFVGGVLATGFSIYLAGKIVR